MLTDRRVPYIYIYIYIYNLYSALHNVQGDYSQMLSKVDYKDVEDLLHKCILTLKKHTDLYT